MDQSRTPSAIAPETPHLGPAPSHHHPVGLLFTLLRHGRGLSHEEAQRRSAGSISSPPRNGSHVECQYVDGPPQAA